MKEFQNIENGIIKEVTKRLGKASVYAKKRIEEKTPEDTKKLLKGYKIQPIEITGNAITQKITNDTEYGYWVEYGVGRVYNYHKPKGNTFISGEGARMMTRTAIENAEELKIFIESNIDVKGIK